jgi:hypothetical protein
MSMELLFYLTRLFRVASRNLGLSCVSLFSYSRCDGADWYRKRAFVGLDLQSVVFGTSCIDLFGSYWSGSRLIHLLFTSRHLRLLIWSV